ncbi:MAG TPA: carboxypeptidase-like regulatory domain-containing protein [Flavobacterium sp.]
MKDHAVKFVGFESEDDVRDVNRRLHELAVWIARNKSNWSKTELAKMMDGVDPLDSEEASRLWDNLFYQVLTQKDFYVKEAIIQMLVANQALENFQKGIDSASMHELLYATVILPKELFVEDAATSAGQTFKLSRIGEVVFDYPGEKMQKQQALSLAALNSENYTNLQKELSKIEKSYTKERNAAYKAQFLNYEKAIKPAIDQYTADTEAVQNAWCSIRPDADYNPADPCHQPPLPPKPVIPAFEFNFRTELDYAYLKSKLSPQALDTLNEIFDIPVSQAQAKLDGPEDDLETALGELETFQELHAHIGGSVANNNQVILDNTETEENTYVSVGGVIIPSASPASAPFAFKVCSKIVSRVNVNFDMEITVPDSSWQVSGITYHSSYPTGANNTNGFYIPSRVGNTIYLKNLYKFGIPLQRFSDTVEFFGEITFSNGIKKNFSIENFDTISCFSGILAGKDTAPASTHTGAGEAPFVPSGFGVKQLGIADYKRVEQSVQCYVEGEVAGIENIMARERREKSTRRLRKSENTTTTSSDTEKEQLTDTTSTERFEMQSEVAKVIQQTKDMSAGTSLSGSYGDITFSANANFASHTSKEDSIKQAVTNAKEITAKALDRVVTKVHEERIEKIIEEFEENNIHEFDNRKGDKHVVGVYRWVDKIYKNQIFNYGKRLMFEFMVPQPAKLHVLAMKEKTVSGTILTPPEDPRKSTTMTIADAESLTDLKLQYWAGKYNAEITAMPQDNISVGESFKIVNDSASRASLGKVEATSGNGAIKIPEGYVAHYAKGVFNAVSDHHSSGGRMISLAIGNHSEMYQQLFYSHEMNVSGNISNFINEVPVSFTLGNHCSGDVTASVSCKLTEAAKKQWRQEAFKAIIDAYESALEDFNQKLADEKEKGETIKGTNPGFYRQIENMVLRKNCISYMVDQHAGARNTYGKRMDNNLSSLGSYEVAVSQDLDNYAAFAKFIEQAFEWEIMSYNFYPYYWGDRADWTAMYQYNESDDPLFRSFMQSGMARVVLTVRPGFEEAVRFYMQTGQIWNGGEVPVIEDELFLSIVDELRQPEGEKEGKAWVTRVPTTLTILQADSIGLKVERALPCHCEDVNEETFEDPSQVPCSDNFSVTEAQMNGTETGTAKLMGTITGTGGIVTKVQLKNLDGSIRDLAYTGDAGEWELTAIPAGRYELLLDATNQLPDTEFMVVEGSKSLAVTLEDGQAMEIDLVVTSN